MLSQKNDMKSKLIPKIAEFVGIMLGDGYINYSKNNRLKISFNSIVDKDYLFFVKKMILDVFGVKTVLKHRDNENTSELFVFEKKFLSFLIEDIGLIESPKWNRASIPENFLNNHLEKYVLRGYFDTDGCVVMTNNNGIIYPRLEMKISPSPMQHQFIEIIERLGFRFGVYNIGKGKVRIQMNGKKELKKWCELVGFSNIKHEDKAKLFV